MDEFQKHIAQLRDDFTFSTLNEKDVEANPFFQFEKWLLEAVAYKVPEVQAMQLCTVSSHNSPSSRIVYLREFKNHNFIFYGNYNSKKGLDLSLNPNAALNFFWPQLERQIRIEGEVKIISSELSDQYFNSRPRESQIGAWASNQSETILKRSELEEKNLFYEKHFKGKAVTRPPHWGGWSLEANYYEFWQGRKSRLHDRISYSLTQNSWHLNRLAP
ncbi:MAG: pyridoxamine 5'-phosphate oxidase [Bacteroidota bacterium]